MTEQRVGRITRKTVELLHKRAHEANAVAAALYEDGHYAASHELTQAALYLASACQALEKRLPGAAG
ncbi:MAG TPA: hypothetical protein VIQ29_04430 [Ancylobacter sp.]